MSHTTITKIQGFEVLDSRGNPTVRVEVTLQSGAIGIAAVPSGASTGGHEACEKRDGDPARYGGKGVRSAVHAVNDELARALIGRDAAEQKTIDRILCETDGTGDKSNLGANAILGVSLAVTHAAAAACRLPLWQYLTRFTGRRPALPRPMMNILNGGRHAPNNIDIQEFMIIPLGCPTLPMGWSAVCGSPTGLGALLEEAGLACGVGDEGGFAPRLKNEEQALELILRAIEDCRLRPGEDMALALDAAAGEWQTGNNMYLLPKENRLRTPHDLLEYWRRLTAKYPIISLEDPAGEDDWDLWRQLTEAIGKNVQLVGDDLFVTQKARLEQGLARRAANAVLIKPNQVGTLTETLETVALAQQSGYGAILSHRSGETEDTTIADLAVATACGQIKTGAPAAASAPPSTTASSASRPCWRKWSDPARTVGFPAVSFTHLCRNRKRPGRANRPSGGFGGGRRPPPTAPRSGAGPAGRPTPCKPRDPAADRPPSAGGGGIRRNRLSDDLACGRLSPHKNPKRRPSHRERRPIFIYSAYSHFFRRKYRTNSTTTATATTMMTG